MLCVLRKHNRGETHTHQVIVLDSITSSAKSSVFRKQSLSSSLSIHCQRPYSNTSRNRLHICTVQIQFMQTQTSLVPNDLTLPNDQLLKFFLFCFYIKCLESYIFKIRFKKKQKTILNNALNNSALQRDGQVLNPQLFEILCVQ